MEQSHLGIDVTISFGYRVNHVHSFDFSPAGWMIFTCCHPYVLNICNSNFLPRSALLEPAEENRCLLLYDECELNFVISFILYLNSYIVFSLFRIGAGYSIILVFNINISCR